MSELTIRANAHLTDEYKEKLTRIVESPTFIDDVCAHVANGGTLCNLCETWGVRYSDVASYVCGRKDTNDRYIRALNDREEWAKERILAELRLLALSDIRQAFDDKGVLKPIKDIPEPAARAIQSVEVDEIFEGQGAEREMIGYTRKVKFWDKTKALELTAKQLGLMIERHEVNGKMTLEDLVSRAQIVDVSETASSSISIDPASQVSPQKLP